MRNAHKNDTILEVMKTTSSVLVCTFVCSVLTSEYLSSYDREVYLSVGRLQSSLTPLDHGLTTDVMLNLF